jgi:hypothetical protein
MGACVCMRDQSIAGLPLAWTESSGGRWLPPTSCYLPDQACTTIPRLGQALSREGIPLATGLPAWLQDMWFAHVPGTKTLTPSAVRAHLNHKGPHLKLKQSSGSERTAVRALCLQSPVHTVLAGLSKELKSQQDHQKD